MKVEVVLSLIPDAAERATVINRIATEIGDRYGAPTTYFSSLVARLEALAR